MLKEDALQLGPTLKDDALKLSPTLKDVIV